MIIKMLETDEEFIKLLPLVVGLSLKVDVPLWEQLREITESMANPNYLTQIMIEREKIISYLSGYFTNPKNFLISQAFSMKPSLSMKMYKEFEKRIYDKGGRQVVMMTPYNPRVFKRYGFQFQRFLLSKQLKGGN